MQTIIASVATHRMVKRGEIIDVLGNFRELSLKSVTPGSPRKITPRLTYVCTELVQFSVAQPIWGPGTLVCTNLCRDFSFAPHTFAPDKP